MAGGLFALLDDVAALARLAAASVDDIGAAAGREADDDANGFARIIAGLLRDSRADPQRQRPKKYFANNHAGTPVGYELILSLAQSMDLP